MYIVVIGAGHVGLHLIQSFSQRGERIAVIDKSERKCRHVSTTFDAVAFVGSGKDRRVLRSAELEKADMLFAVTDNDLVNLAACRMAKKDFAVPYVVALANSPRRKEELKDAGADEVICPLDEAIRLVENALRTPNVSVLFIDPEEDCKLVRVTIPLNASVAGKTVRHLDLPPGCKVGLICGRNGLVFPDKGTQIAVHDQVFLLGAREAVDDGVRKLTMSELA